MDSVNTPSSPLPMSPAIPDVDSKTNPNAHANHIIHSSFFGDASKELEHTKYVEIPDLSHFRTAMEGGTGIGSGCEYSDGYEIDMRDDARMETEAKRIRQEQRWKLKKSRERMLKQRQKGILKKRRMPMLLQKRKWMLL